MEFVKKDCILYRLQTKNRIFYVLRTSDKLFETNLCLMEKMGDRMAHFLYLCHNFSVALSERYMARHNFRFDRHMVCALGRQRQSKLLLFRDDKQFCVRIDFLSASVLRRSNAELGILFSDDVCRTFFLAEKFEQRKNNLQIKGYLFTDSFL